MATPRIWLSCSFSKMHALSAPVPVELLAYGLKATLHALGDVTVREGAPRSPDDGVIAEPGPADVTLDCGIAEEACPLNLVPTASTTAMLAFGDAQYEGSAQPALA